MIIKNLLILVSFIDLILFVGCKNNGTAPPVIKNPRDYSWTIDTLSFQGSAQTMMTSLWGSSPTDVYAVGHNDQSIAVMWHYDGKSWTNVKLNPREGGGNTIDGPLSLFSIYGFSQNNI